jgi:hypothetical protein
MAKAQESKANISVKNEQWPFSNAEEKMLYKISIEALALRL